MKNFLGFNRLSFRQGDTSDNKDKSSNEIDNKFLTYNFSQLPPLPKKPPPQTDDRNTVFLKNYFIKGLLSSFLKQRPSYLELKEEGIIKGSHFIKKKINSAHFFFDLIAWLLYIFLLNLFLLYCFLYTILM